MLSGTQSLLQAVAAGTSLHWPCSAQVLFFLMGLAGRRQFPGAPLSFAVKRPHSETHAFYVKLGDFLFLLCFWEPLIEQSGFREQKGVGVLFRPGLTSSVVLWPASAPALTPPPCPPRPHGDAEPVSRCGFHSERDGAPWRRVRG